MRGIYKITNTTNNRIYIGSSKNVEYRFVQHLSQLMANTHHSYKLQSDFNKYGISAFSFNILEIVANDKDLLKREQYYIDLYDASNDMTGYNVAPYVNWKYMKSELPLSDISYYCDSVSNWDKDFIKQNIDILDHTQMNNINKSKTNLSKAWFLKNPKEVETLRKNIYNYFHNILKSKDGDFYWTSFIGYQSKLSTHGVVNGFITMNPDLGDRPKRNKLAFAANVYMNEFLRRDYKETGIIVDTNKYTLSVLVKWIMTVSDITKPISIYIPSIRMRNLLINWLDSDD